MEPKADDIPVAGCVQAGSLLFSCPATGKSGSSPMDFCPASCLPGNIQAKYQTPVTPTVHLSFLDRLPSSVNGLSRTNSA
ncbi:hypothetical protein, partial [Faecalibaculum rodentium]|uniref:hypothetical protein n=1 Tax=Faecalibaculum rodentium TaxID=1702221 RepID=UPI00272F07B3